MRIDYDDWINTISSECAKPININLKIFSIQFHVQCLDIVTSSDYSNCTSLN